MIHGLPNVTTSTSASLQPQAADFTLPDLIETSPTPPPAATSGTNPPRPLPAPPKASTPETNANISASTSEPKYMVPPTHWSIQQIQNFIFIIGTPNPPQPPPSRQPIPPGTIPQGPEVSIGRHLQRFKIWADW
ncbi:hypothetical protein PQX77_021268 [Marasmius sp. AFHP31]|nr:hypothetical protein PQX77_021268 [Marasmius sp. AFHP31]